MGRKILNIVGYFLAFLLFLLLFIRMTFPTTALGNMLKVRLADATGATSVVIGDVSLLGLIPSGLSLEGVEVTFKDVAMKTEVPGKDRMLGRLLQADELSVRASLGGLTSGEIDASFEGTVMGGTISGGRIIVPKEGIAELRIEAIEGVAIGAERLFASATGFDLRGTLSGSVDLKMPLVIEENGKRLPQLSGLEGSINLVIGGAVVKDPVVERMQMRQALTDVTLGDVKLTAKAGGGGSNAAASDKGARPRSGTTTIQFEELSASGPDVQLGVAPRAALVIPSGRPFNQSTIRTHFAIRVDEGYITREIDDPKNPGKKTQPNKIIQMLLEDLGRKGHLQDGDIGLAVTGPLSKPGVVTEKPRTRIGASGTAGRRMNVDAGEGDGDGGEGEEPGDEGSTSPVRPAPRVGRQGGAVTRPVVGGGRPVAAAPIEDSEGVVRPAPSPDGGIPGIPEGEPPMDGEAAE